MRSRVQRLDWLPQSLDLSPTENSRKQLKDRISARRHGIRTIEEMEIALQQEWAKIEAETPDKLTESMPARIDQMLKSKGGLDEVLNVL
jgi:hypothetical protein